MATEQAPASVPSIEERMATLFDPQPEVAQTEQEPAEVQAQIEDTPEPTEQPDDGTEELDVDGNIYKVPKELKAKVSEWKEGNLRQADYTRKTQTLADLHRQAQIANESIAQRQQFEQSIVSERSELMKVTADIERYKQVDWGSLEVSDYIKLKSQMDTLKERAQELSGVITGKANEFQNTTAQTRKKLVDEGQKYLQRTIPNWGSEAVQGVMSSAKEVGYTDSELDNVYDARFVALAWKASQYDKIQSGKSSAVASVQKAPPIVKPGSKGISQSVSRDKALRAEVKSKGDLKSVAALLAHRMR
jgi:hypothetical protein